MEDDSTSMNNLIEQLLKEGLGLSDEPLQIQRSHRSLRSKLLALVQPRSIVANFLSYKTKEMVLRTAWQKRRSMWRDQRITLDNAYPPHMLHKHQEYAETCKLLRDKKVPFKTFHPAHPRDGLQGDKIYHTAVEAIHDIAKRGFPITVIQTPDTLLERIRQLTWKKRTRSEERRPQRPRVKVSCKKKLQSFRRATTPPSGPSGDNAEWMIAKPLNYRWVR